MGSNELNELFNEYNQEDKAIESFEAQATTAKSRRDDVAGKIHAQHGNGPHVIDGKTLIVAKSRAGTFYLRPPITRTPKGKKSEGTEPETTDASTEETTTEASTETI